MTALYIRPRAWQDMARIDAYLAERDPAVADRFSAALEITFQQIRQSPGIGHQEGFRRLAGVRSWRVEGFGRYLVFYRTIKGGVRIIRVLHGMRNLPRFFRPQP